MLRGVFARLRLRRLERERAVVHTVDGRSLEGYVTGVYADALELTTATLLGGGEDGSDVSLDGSILVPREHVSFVQHLARVTPAELYAAQRRAAQNVVALEVVQREASS